ncbi:MAG: twin-arginine translocase subunit TatC [Nitrososphaerota archaeon]
MKTSEKPRNMKEMTLLEHLMELRDRLKVCLITIGVMTLIMLVFPSQIYSPQELLEGYYKPMISVILELLRNAVKPAEMMLIGQTITAPLEIYFIASLVFGLAFSSPVIGYEIFKYVDPALYPHERRMIYPFLSAFLGLFLAGLLFGLYVITPFTFRAMLIFFELVGAEPIITIMDFYTTILVVTLATGAVFTTPVILNLLVRVGLLSTKSIGKYRRWIYGGMYIVAAIITPDGGMFANLILLAVFIVLFEGGMLFARRYEKRKEKLEKGEEEVPEDRCRFCGKPLGGRIFCPSCGRSQV